LTLTDLDGQQVTLSDLRGNRVLLNFWATWCAYCRGERGVLQQAHDEQGSQGLVILAVAIGEDPDRLRSFVHERGLSYRILLDEDGSVSRTYRVRGIPSSFFIDRDGVIRVHHVGALEPELLAQYLERVQ
jgi:peroxiredoxin